MKRKLERFLPFLGLAAFFLLSGLSEYTEDNTSFDMPKIHKKENENWYAADSNLEADPSLFHQKAQEEFQRMESQIAEMKQKFETGGGGADKNQVAGLEKKLGKARRDYKILKASSDASLKDARAAFDSSMSSLNEGARETASSVLSGEQAFQWQMRSKIDDRAYQIKQLKSALLKSEEQARVQDQLEERIAGLEQKNKDAASNLEKSKDKDSQEETRKKFESELEDFDEDYLKTLADVKKSR